jgi:hypothetical protein
VVAVLSGAVGEAVANQIPLILPEKLIRNKVGALRGRQAGRQVGDGP